MSALQGRSTESRCEEGLDDARADQAWRVGIDTGGTFTDLVAIDVRSGAIVTYKTPSDPELPEAAVIEALGAMDFDSRDVRGISLGTTTATNAALQRGGARIIAIATADFEDVPFIQRITRRYPYDPSWEKPNPGVARRDCIGANERIDKAGNVLVPLTGEELARIASQIEEVIAGDPDADWAVAVNLLFSYANPEHERMIADRLRASFPTLAISCSHDVSPIWREYERGITTFVDASIRRLVSDLAARTQIGMRELGFEAPLSIMKSNGGQLDAEAAATHPVQMLLSGLAGGVIGGRYFGRQVGMKDVVTLDMGGTSTDVALVLDDRFGYTTRFELEWGLPVVVPMLDFRTIGAGGGSVAWTDFGGLLRVGPRSAGAHPGPAAYGRGGAEATVTDANLVLGRFDPAWFLGGRMTLNREAAARAVGELGNSLGMTLLEAAHAIVRTVNEEMAGAIRLVTVERGIDARDFSLAAFGGAGPMHAAELAEDLAMRNVVVPLHPGLCSAFGAALADRRSDQLRTVYFRSDRIDVRELVALLDAITRIAVEAVEREGYERKPIVQRSLGMRYLGQNYEQEIPVPTEPLDEERFASVIESFHRRHEELFGYRADDAVVEVLQIGVTAIGPLEAPSLPKVRAGPAPAPFAIREVSFRHSGYENCPFFRRAELPAGASVPGPAIVVEPDSTIVVPPGHVARVAPAGVVLIEHV